MKKQNIILYCTALIFLFLFTTFTHAEEYENIAGFKVGAKIELNENIKKIPKDKITAPKSSNQYASNHINFFDFVVIGTNKANIIERLAFFKSYAIDTIGDIRVVKNTIKDDFHLIYNQITKRYGEFNISKSEDMFGVFSDFNSFYISKVYQYTQNINPKSKYLGAIGLTLRGNGIGLDGGELTLELEYWTPEFLYEMEQKALDQIGGF